MDSIVEFQIFQTFRKLYQKVTVFGFEQIIGFVMNIDKLDLVNLVGKVFLILIFLP